MLTEQERNEERIRIKNLSTHERLLLFMNIMDSHFDFLRDALNLPDVIMSLDHSEIKGLDVN